MKLGTQPSAIHPQEVVIATRREKQSNGHRIGDKYPSFIQNCINGCATVIFRSSFFFSAVSVRDLEKIMSRKDFSGAGKQSAFLDSAHSDMDKICCCPQSVQSSDHLAETLAILAAAPRTV